MNNTNEAKDLVNQIAERNKSMSSMTYCVATVSSSELDFEAKATNKEGKKTDSSIGATLIFNVGSVYKRHGLPYGSLIKKIVQASGNTMIECNAETR